MFDLKMSDCKEVSFTFVFENLSELGKESEYHSFGGFTAIFNGVERSFDWMDTAINDNGDGTYTVEMYHIDDDCFTDKWKDKQGYPLYEDMKELTEFTEFYYETAYKDCSSVDDIYGYAEPIRILSGKFFNPDTKEEFELSKELLSNINKYTEDDSNGYKQN